MKAVLIFLILLTTSYLSHSQNPVGQWMRATLATTDVLFDFQALESNEGTCKENNNWLICTENRNTTSDPSDVNGVDSSPGQGHMGKKPGQRISKALLMSIYKSGK